MSILSKIYIFISLTLALLFAGCSDDALRSDLPADDQEEQMAGNFFIHLRMNLCENGIPASRADGTDPGTGTGDGTGTGSSTPLYPETPGSGREREIKTLDLLVYDASVNPDDNDRLIDIVSLSEAQISVLTSATGLTVPIFAKKGMKISISAVANMPEKMRSQFVINQTKGRTAYAVSTGADYWDVINEFVPGSDGKQSLFESATGKGIPMTGQFIKDDATGNPEDFIFEVTDAHKTKDNPLRITAELTRIVAKIHVLAKAQEYTIGSGSQQEKVLYVFAQDDYNTADKSDNPGNSGNPGDSGGDFDNWIGWSRLKNVRYIPNGTNKSTYLFPQEKTRGEQQWPRWKDLNMDLESYVLGRENPNLGLGFNNNWRTDYVFYSGVSLHNVNIDKYAKHVEDAERYEETKLSNTINNTSGEIYTNGMYCLENYFNEPDPDYDGDDIANTFSKYADVIPMVTHVSIIARLIPRNIVILKDYASDMDKFIEQYEQNQPKFYKDYELTKEDFDDTDVAAWNRIKLNTKDSQGRNYFEDNYYIFLDQYRIYRANTEIDAMYILKWSMQANKLWTRDPAIYETGKYSACTFFVYDTNSDIMTIQDTTPPGQIVWNQKYLYLTAGAVSKANDKNAFIKTYSIPHLGGWGYYYTYLDDPAKGEINSSTDRTPYTSSQVTRNKYYILTINKFSSPGGTITRPEYIKVNTQEVGWDYTGKGEVNLH